MSKATCPVIPGTIWQFLAEFESIRRGVSFRKAVWIFPYDDSNERHMQRISASRQATVSQGPARPCPISARRPASVCSNASRELDYQPKLPGPQPGYRGRSYLIGLWLPACFTPSLAEVPKRSPVHPRQGLLPDVGVFVEGGPSLEREVNLTAAGGAVWTRWIIASTGTNIEQFERMEAKAQAYVLGRSRIVGAWSKLRRHQ